MHGREHLVGIKALGRGLVLYILRYADELREPSHYFEGISAEANPQAIKLAAELIERESGRFEPEKMPDDFAAALRELLQAKIEQRAPVITVAAEDKPAPQVINIMAALKESMQAKGRSRLKQAVAKRSGKAAHSNKKTASPRERSTQRRSAH
jgi:DNA end-binding protein Ku